jgi:hypothetical protein
MEPVRIRLYGLMSMTRRGYIMQLGAAVLLMIILIVIRLSLPPLPHGRPDQPLPPTLAWTVFLLDNLHWFVVGLAVLFTIEAYLVLKAFDRAEAAQKARAQP